MKKEITIKNTIKEMLWNNFKGVIFNEYHLIRIIKGDIVIYKYEFKVNEKNYVIKVNHDLIAKTINFKCWRLFSLIAEHNIQYI